MMLVGWGIGIRAPGTVVFPSENDFSGWQLRPV